METLILNNFRGINRLSSRMNMSQEFAWNISNGYVKKDIKSGLGTIKQRPGVTKFNSSDYTNSTLFIYEPKWNAGGTDVIIREGTRWAKYDGVDSFDDLDTGRTSGVRGQAAMFANELIMVDGGVPRKCTAAYAVANLSADAAMPTKSDAVHVHQHKVWINNLDYPMKAHYSKTDSANAATSWSAASDAGSIDFTNILPTGDRLIGFKTFANVLLVFIFTRHAVVYVCGTDPAEFALQQIIPLNCISGHALTQIGDDLALCSQEGVNSFRSSMTNQDLDIDDLSKYISPLYRELIQPLADKTVVSTAFCHNLNHLYVCIPGTNPTILVYSIDIQNFVGVWAGYKCHSVCERQDGTMLVGGDGYVYTMNSGTSDDGSVIPFSYDFPCLYAKDPDHNKAFRQIEGLVVHSGNPTLKINYEYDGGESYASSTVTFTSSGVDWDSDEAIWDSADWSGTEGAERFLSSNLLGRGKGLILSLANTTLNASVEIPFLLLRYRTEGVKIR